MLKNCENTVAAPRSMLAWIGGKFNLAKKLIPLFPAHVCYCEVFGGAAHVLFAKKPSSCEVFNDLNGELVNFWRVFARFPQWFIYKLQYALYSREIFEILKAQNTQDLSEEERAWRFLYLNACSFSGIMYKDSHTPRFSIGRTDASPLRRFFNLRYRIEAAHKRFERVIIDNLDWRDCIRLYDGPGTFFYIDPPYSNDVSIYGRGLFGTSDYAEMAQVLTNIKGKFLLSLDDTPENRQRFAAFELSNVDAIYTNKNLARHKRTQELLIRNYEL